MTTEGRWSVGSVPGNVVRDGRVVAVCRGAEAEQHAQTIVTACNQHEALVAQRDALLAALEGMLDALVAQRDALLAALEGMLDQPETPDAYDAMIARAQAAIQKARGR